MAGEAGLRVGVVKALRWREDVDLVAKTITVNQQTCKGDTGTPKGRTRASGTRSSRPALVVFAGAISLMGVTEAVRAASVHVAQK